MRFCIRSIILIKNINMNRYPSMYLYTSAKTFFVGWEIAPRAPFENGGDFQGANKSKRLLCWWCDCPKEEESKGGGGERGCSRHFGRKEEGGGNLGDKNRQDVKNAHSWAGRRKRTFKRWKRLALLCHTYTYVCIWLWVALLIPCPYKLSLAATP